MLIGTMHFSEVWLVDFEFSVPQGGRPTPICLVARELTRDRTLRIWEDELKVMSKPPYAIDEDSLFVAYYASAEMSCNWLWVGLGRNCIWQIHV